MIPTLPPRPTRSFFAYSRWDIVPALMIVAHMLFVGTLFFAFHLIPWAVWIPLAMLYSISISWSINSSSHNLIHNPFFRWAWLNRACSVVLSLTDGFSQEFYHHVHLRHHVGNMDRVKDGTTIDPTSIYRNGKGDQPENPWTYTFYSYFRDDIGDVYRRVKAKSPVKAAWIRREIWTLVIVYLVCLAYDWRAFLAMLPFYYFGHCLSSLTAYYEHYKADTETPIAWGVSTYGWFYNITWLYNGYHAEHHYRPILSDQRRAGVRVIRWPHALGFFDNAPPAGPATAQRHAQVETAAGGIKSG
jgi:fatty acid desaturase